MGEGTAPAGEGGGADAAGEEGGAPAAANGTADASAAATGTAADIAGAPAGKAAGFSMGVGGGELVAAACNRRETDADPAAHAEFLAVEAAARALGRWRLSDCTVYVTLEPCLMCAGLMYQARIRRCVFAASDPKAGALGTLYSVHADERLNHRFEACGGVRADESAALLKSFFTRLREAR